MGSWINDQWVGVTQEDLTQYWVLVTIGFACSFLPLLFIWMIPTHKQIAELQESMKTVETEESTAIKGKHQDGMDEEDRSDSTKGDSSRKDK